jgi:hypothetical protein
LSNQKISDQVLTASNTAATAADGSQVALADLSAATVGAVGSQMTFAAAPELPTATAATPFIRPYVYLSPGSKTSTFTYGALGAPNDLGTFRKGTHIALVDWDGENNSPPGRYHVGYDEEFGIAPDRTIWHSWNGSNGWQEMMNGTKPALADEIWDAAWNPINNKHTIVVEVTTGVSSPQLWASDDIKGHWGNWYPVT